MPLGILFWVIFVLWVVLGVYRRYSPGAQAAGIGSDILNVVLIFILGWRCFGFVVQN